jgi:hypothetical protein
MSRPAGVTASAIVAILGSISFLLFAVMAVLSVFIVPSQSRLPNSAQLLLGCAVIYVALGGVGIWTSVGLFRLRSWARTSILVFAGFVVAISIFALVATMAVPMPPEIMAGTGITIYRVMAVTFGIPLAIGVWWLIQFNTRSTKAAFASPMPEGTPRRPLSISIIAWASIVAGASSLIGILGRLPAFLFGVHFTGWTAAAIYVLFGVILLYIGKGLLDLRERARLVAIGWSVASIVQAGLVTLVPTLRQRTLELQRSFIQNQPNPIVFDQGVVMNVGLAFSAVVVGAVIWFLVRNRAAFVPVGPA